jgi:JmjC domain, hydroxylase/C5HC2 zinc finger
MRTGRISIRIDLVPVFPFPNVGGLCLRRAAQTRKANQSRRLALTTFTRKHGGISTTSPQLLVRYVLSCPDDFLLLRHNILQYKMKVLEKVKVAVNGVNVPWVYFGCLFSTFCWHNEDNHLYSCNYNHKGAPKLWYGVPGNAEAAKGFEKVFRSYLSLTLRDNPDLMHHITTMFSPRLLQNSNVPVYKIVQHEGEFVFTFPRGYHGGFSLGPNVGEAVNFATHDWIAYGAGANEHYRSLGRPAVFSHDRLTLTMANNVGDLKSAGNCLRLLKELERVVDEEIGRRDKLLASGVRDVSDQIILPKNRLDQLDEKSANYDDKRCCFACKHVCFFSAVGCSCSTSKVSCLRHSYSMCRCPSTSRYFMIWSTKDELLLTLERVRRRYNVLSEAEEQDTKPSAKAENTTASSADNRAPGVAKYLQMYQAVAVSADPVDGST